MKTGRLKMLRMRLWHHIYNIHMASEVMCLSCDYCSTVSEGLQLSFVHMRCICSWHNFCAAQYTVFSVTHPWTYLCECESIYNPSVKAQVFFLAKSIIWLRPLKIELFTIFIRQESGMAFCVDMDWVFSGKGFINVINEMLWTGLYWKFTLK